MKWFYFLLGGLATYRLARMISMESGPSFIFRRLRGIPSQKKHPSVKEGLSCLCCTSFYIGAVMAVYFLLQGWATWPEVPLYWFSFSSVAVLLNLFTKPDA